MHRSRIRWRLHGERGSTRALAARWVSLTLLVGGLLGACQSEEADQGPEPGEQGVVEGVSREEIRQRVESMTPEQAETLGIVDTSIHLESPTSPGDSALVPDTLRLTAPDTGG